MDALKAHHYEHVVVAVTTLRATAKSIVPWTPTNAETESVG